MPKSTTNEKNRLTHADLEGTQARERLQDLVDHLSNFPNASRSLRYAADAIKKYLRGGYSSLDEAFNLVAHSGTPRRRGNQPLSDEQVRTVAKMLRKGAEVPVIVKSCNLSKTTVDRVKTEYRALLHIVQGYSRIKHGELREGDWKTIERRARSIDPPEWRKPIIQGIADVIYEEGDLIDQVDPANPFAPLPVNPH